MSSSEDSDSDQIVKKVKNDDDQNKISRKTSDDLIKYFERIPEEQLNRLLDFVKNSNSPDLPVKIDINKYLARDTFALDASNESSEAEKKRKKRESKEKECKCCKQVVKRHHCQHTLCEKPCLMQDKGRKKP